MKRVYLDHAATTLLNSMVFKKMMPYLKEKYGNASSIHKLGQEARIAVEESREKVAKFLNCKPIEIVFTGSATESDNLAIRGLLKRVNAKNHHIIIASTEHKAVFETCKELEKEGIKTTYLSVNKEGLINLNDLEKKIRPETILVSIMYANNETGVVQPVREIGKLIAKINKKRDNKIYFHTDAVQAANWLDCNIDKLNVDLLTLSSHKIYGPKGVGVLFVREKTPISQLITGGDHEWNLRAGTENVAGIVGMGFAIEQIKKNQTSKNGHVEHLRNKLVKGVLKISNTRLNSPINKQNRSPHIANFSFMGVEGEGLVIALDQKGIATSTGSACSSSSLMPSHVLIAMGLSELQSHSSLRISLGKQTTEQEINYFLKTLPEVIKRLRKISGR